ncbi:hypothetical protein [Pelagerythrobacter sp.]|uniref:hypothetical protein n=1 Tax=Pelagerythrobacter sp. TaxID=2800702 RepID=UPI0035ADA685
MTARWPALGLALALAACSGDAPVQAQAEEGAQRIECAIGSGAEFAADCLIERTAIDDATVLVVRHPDGGFRRFEQLAGGAGLAAYDGADNVEQQLAGDVLEVSVAGDRYRFPARPAQDSDAAE